MSEKCANCGRADLLQPDVANYHCLACGELTDIATGQVVRKDVPNVTTAPSGHPVIDLSTGQRVNNPFDYPQEATSG